MSPCSPVPLSLLERTGEEQERTRQFAKEVVDLLRHQPHCRMAFSKFIPTYHHHFGRQCKLTHYGFTKLVELFEAIPDVLMVRGPVLAERERETVCGGLLDEKCICV